MISLKEALISKNRGNVGSKIDNQVKIEELFDFIDKYYKISNIRTRQIISRNEYSYYFNYHDNIIDSNNSDILIEFDGSHLRTNPDPGRLLPMGFKFGKVVGSMCINEFETLTSLEGCPDYVGGRFEISDCYNLKSLKGAPTSINRDFWIISSGVKSLKDGPEYIGGRVELSGCHSLKSLEGMPTEVGGITISNCSNLGSLKGMSKVKNYIDLVVNDSLESLEGCPDRCQSLYLRVEEGGPENLKGIPKVVDNEIIISGFVRSLYGMPENFKGILDIHNASHINSLKFCPKSISQVYVSKWQIQDFGVVAKSKVKLYR